MKSNEFLRPLFLQYLTPALLHHAVTLDQKVLGGLWTLDGYRQELERSSSALIGIIPQPEQDLDQPLLGLGCLWGIEDEAHITLLMVAPNYRRQGFGQLLLCGLLAIAHQRNLARATLEVRASNQIALSLYQKFGFQIAGCRKGYYHQTNEDALILWRGHLQTPAFQKTLQSWQHILQRQLKSKGWQASFIEI